VTPGGLLGSDQHSWFSCLYFVRVGYDMDCDDEKYFTGEGFWLMKKRDASRT